jgi:hypothetical protein
MATITTLVSGTFTTVLTTELNSLANNATTAASAAYSAGAGYLMTEVELVAGRRWLQRGILSESSLLPINQHNIS